MYTSWLYVPSARLPAEGQGSYIIILVQESLFPVIMNTLLFGAQIYRDEFIGVKNTTNQLPFCASLVTRQYPAIWLSNIAKLYGWKGDWTKVQAFFDPFGAAGPGLLIRQNCYIGQFVTFY